MISDERLEQFAHDKRMCNVTEEIVSMAKELIAMRKAFSEPAAWVNRTDVEQFEPHILAKRSKSLACTLPLYRKPIDSAT
ncbi:hypothetical protein [Pantoea sp. GbtcB22]|uniref:hypothetical protein n=1 Tax=Pantoea sp. GbtcB22 TaxID=2824767 RepID=UPI001C2FE36C|nr:hypothetical protein [Pantoea sp. GbtcB22]